MVAFDDQFRCQLRELFIWRRDVRHFQTDPLPDGALERLIDIACLSPSVGLSQPWRFVIVEDAARRRAVIDDFKACNADALACYSSERAARYAALKLSGLEEAPGHLAVFADKASDIGHGLGRAMVRAFVQRTFEDPAVTVVQTDPHPSNLRAIRCYERAGFVRVGSVTTPDGEALLMRCTR